MFFCIEIPIESISLWNCETPYLYYFEVKLGDDRAISYFAMRKFSLETKVHEEFLRICLNGEVQFQNGVLDQGYWPESLYTPPSDAAMIFDIQEMKKTGFNMVRKHLKIEPQRWYYHCDRLGIVVWQDMVNGGSYYKHWFVTYGATLLSWLRIPMRDVYPRLLSREAKAGRLEFIREMKETIRLLGNHPSIAAWVIFNEGWGQFQTEDMTRIVRRLDPNRLIDQASGWFDQGGGDFPACIIISSNCSSARNERGLPFFQNLAVTAIGNQVTVQKKNYTAMESAKTKKISRSVSSKDGVVCEI